MSLDGYVTGPDSGLGRDGDAIQRWACNAKDSPRDEQSSSTPRRVPGDFRIHPSPVLMGAGTRLFDLVDERILLTQTDVVVTDHATRLAYRAD
jgi:hypothetical protein